MGAHSTIEHGSALGEQGEEEWGRLRANLDGKQPRWLTFLCSASMRSAQVIRGRLEAALQQEGKSLLLLQAESPYQLAHLLEAARLSSQNGRRASLCWVEVSGAEAAHSDSEYWLLTWQDFFASLEESIRLAQRRFPGGMIVSALPRIRWQLQESAPELVATGPLILQPLPTWVRPDGANGLPDAAEGAPKPQTQQPALSDSPSAQAAKPPADPAQGLLKQARQLLFQKKRPLARQACHQALKAFAASSDRHGQAWAHYWLARVERADSHPALALHHAKLALECGQGDQPDRLKWLDLAAQMLLQAGDAQQALQCCCQGIELAESLLQAQPGNAALMREQAVLLSRQGDALLKAGDAGGALGCYERSLRIRRRLVRRSSTAQALRDLSYALYALGQMHLRRADLESAHKLTEESLYVDRKIIETVGATPSTVRDYAASLHLTAHVLDRLGRKEPAQLRRRQAERLEKRLRSRLAAP